MFKYYNWANLDRQQAFSISSEPSIYTVFGKYGHFTAHWLEYFDMSQFLILDGHKFRHDNPAVSLNKVESFLRLKDHFRKEHFEKGKDGRFFCHKSWFGCGPRGKGRLGLFPFPYPESGFFKAQVHYLNLSLFQNHDFLSVY